MKRHQGGLPPSADLDPKLWERQCGGVAAGNSHPESLRALSAAIS